MDKMKHQQSTTSSPKAGGGIKLKSSPFGSPWKFKDSLKSAQPEKNLPVKSLIISCFYSTCVLKF